MFIKKINPNDYQEIIKKYGSAKKFIEHLLLLTLCNPFVTNGLKIINGFKYQQYKLIIRYKH